MCTRLISLLSSVLGSSVLLPRVTGHRSMLRISDLVERANTASSPNESDPTPTHSQVWLAVADPYRIAPHLCPRMPSSTTCLLITVLYSTIFHSVPDVRSHLLNSPNRHRFGRDCHPLRRPLTPLDIMQRWTQPLDDDPNRICYKTDESPGTQQFRDSSSPRPDGGQGQRVFDIFSSQAYQLANDLSQIA